MEGGAGGGGGRRGWRKVERKGERIEGGEGKGKREVKEGRGRGEEGGGEGQEGGGGRVEGREREGKRTGD